MKFLKYITASLLLVVSLASCEGIESGSVGTTTVQFASAVCEDGFGAGYVKVPMIITADTEEAMNSCDVQAVVKVVTTGEKYEGTADVDYRITSLNINFPAYSNYYDEKDPQKYFDEETRKWTKQVAVEVQIVNSSVDELHFTLEIESATTTIGTQKQCSVVLVKTTRDRLCGTYAVSYASSAWYDGTDATQYPAEKYPWTAAVISWYTEGYFALINNSMLGQYGIPFYAYYDDKAEQIYFLPIEPITYYDEAGTQIIYQGFWDEETNDWAAEEVYGEFDIQTGVITFPANLVFRTSVYTCDEEYNPVEFVEDFAPGYKGLVFTKK